MAEDKSPKNIQNARKALEAWIANFNNWCHDPKETGWQNEKK